MIPYCVANEHFHLHCVQAGISSLQRPGDTFPTDYIRPGQTLGCFSVVYSWQDGAWQSQDARSAGPAMADGANKGLASTAQSTETALPLTAHGAFSFEGSALVWRIYLRNTSPHPLQIGQLAIPLDFNTQYVRDPQTTYTQRLVKHSHIAGSASFIFWMRPNGVGPYLLMTPLPGTKLEYFSIDPQQMQPGRWEGPYTVYIHSGHLGATEPKGSWRQARTTLHLGPSGGSNDAVEYGFKFQWAADYQAVRNLLYEEGLLDVYIAPGMTVPKDLTVRIGIRSKQTVTLAAEYPDQTNTTPVFRVRDAGSTGLSAIDAVSAAAIDAAADAATAAASAAAANMTLYDVTFTRLGENILTVHGPGNFQASLEFYVTEPLETLIRKRASFIARKQQHRQPGKWYDGLFSLWDMQQKALLGPEQPGKLHQYMVGGSDDPCLSKPVFLAEKNVVFPEASEIAALDYYIREFVWGKLQRRADEHPHPYGIYGSPNWHANRTSTIGLNSGGLGQEHMWRTFDYPHLILLYLCMYRIAQQNPGTTELASEEYLERAFGTARAFFTVPYNIQMGAPWDFRGWCDWAYKQGNFHERCIIDLITELECAGHLEQAAWLQNEWEKKVKYFLHDHPYPYGSEMYFDSTAFESTHAIAKYALEHDLQPDTHSWYDKNQQRWYSHLATTPEQVRLFLERQIAANIACRGWLETSYYNLGSDYRAGGNSNYTLSYMSQLGGWAVLDYALRYAADPAPYLRLGYASLLSSWCLVNDGAKDMENAGAAAWGFEPAAYTRTWAGHWQGRGPWSYDGEIDHGFTAAVAAAATVVIADPLLGLIAYGGTITQTEQKIGVSPHDGVRQRLYAIVGGPGTSKPGTAHRLLEICLDRDGFVAEQPITLRRDLTEIALCIECRSAISHITLLRLRGVPLGTYCVTTDATKDDVATTNSEVITTTAGELVVQVQMDGAAQRVQIQKVA